MTAGDAAPVPMLDLRAQTAPLRDEIEAGFRRVMDSGQFVLGPNVAQFERDVADYLGVRHAVGCASGTDALLLALLACGIGPGDEVVTTAFSFFGTVEPILHAGARPVFVDIDRSTLNLDPGQVEAAIGPACRAILPVHLFGRPAPMDELGSIARRHRLHLIEDCAQAFGARCHERRAGSFGSAGCFSFFPSKNLGAFGDGGLVVTDSDSIAERVRELGNHGSRERYRHRRVGFNSRLDELQAVVLRAKLKHVDQYNSARRELARRYGERLSGVPGIEPPADDAGHVYHQYTVLFDERDRVASALRASGIASAVHYPLPLHRQPAIADEHTGLELPVADAVARRCLALPMFPELGRADVERVALAVTAALASGAEPIVSD